MTVHAPFRFSPINRWVYFPGWADCVNHDVPFEDGLCGEIAIEIEARTPLLVGGPRRKARKCDDLPPEQRQKFPEGREGEVWPFQLPDGCYAIPGSTLQGMVRSILEIAAFGKLGPWVDKRRFGIRDLAQAARPFYRKYLGDVRAGFLSRKDDDWFITECEKRRIRFSAIPTAAHATASWTASTTAEKRYSWVSSVGPFVAAGDPLNTVLADELDGTSWLVLTGNTGVVTRPKRREFVFVEQNDPKVYKLDASVLEDFRYLHEDNKDPDQEEWNSTWRMFWNKGYADKGLPLKNVNGGPIPIFFILEDDRVQAFGLSSMFKLPYRYTTTDMLRNSCKSHDCEDKVDFPSLIFGSVSNNTNNAGIKRRASFDNAVTNATSLKTVANTILLGPKPSYFPLYVRQVGAAKNSRLRVARELRDRRGNLRTEYAPYVTYTPLEEASYSEADIDGNALRRSEHERPELAGVKAWPARGSIAERFRPPYLPVKDTIKISQSLNAIQGGAVFAGKLRFHNLRLEELGALIWALSFGREEAWNGSQFNAVTRHHRLGMGKPYGFGEVAIRISSANIFNANGRTSSFSIKNIADKFVDLMTREYREKTNLEWKESAQVRTLLVAACAKTGAKYNELTIRSRNAAGSQWSVRPFDYMELNPYPGGWNDFQIAKNDGWFLGRYTHGNEPDKPIPGSDRNCSASGAQENSTLGRSLGKYKVGDRIRSIKNPDQRGMVAGRDGEFLLVKWDNQGGAPQRIGERRIEPEP